MKCLDGGMCIEGPVSSQTTVSFVEFVSGLDDEADLIVLARMGMNESRADTHPRKQGGGRSGAHL